MVVRIIFALIKLIGKNQLLFFSTLFSLGCGLEISLQDLVNETSSPSRNTASISIERLVSTDNPVVLVKLNFTEDVQDLDLQYLKVAGANVVDGSLVGQGKQYHFEVIPVSGIIEIIVPSKVRDGYGQQKDLVARDVRATYEVDMVPPAVSIQSLSGQGSADQTRIFQIHLSEFVKDLRVQDLEILGDVVVTSLVGSGLLYTLTITANSTTNVTIQVPSGVLQDLSGNKNLESNLFSYNYEDPAEVIPDVTSPTLLTIGLEEPQNKTGDQASTFVWKVTYPEADSISLNPSDVTINTDGDIVCVHSVSGDSATVRQVSVSDCTGKGTLRIAIGEGTAAKGDLAFAAVESNTVNIDNLPTIEFFSSSDVIEKSLSSSVRKIKVTSSVPVSEDVEVNIITTNYSTALSAVDYNLGSQKVIIPKGTSVGEMDLEVIGSDSPSRVVQTAIQSIKSESGLVNLGSNQVNRTALLNISDEARLFKKISLATYAVCGITKDSASNIVCWGKHTFGGVDSRKWSADSDAVLLDSTTSYKDISVGDSNACAITTNDKLKCWGSNSSGMAGNGGTDFVESPAFIDQASNYVSVSVGFSHVCAVSSTGVLTCWGRGNMGQLGDGISLSSHIVTTPKVIDSSVKYSSVSAGSQFTCGITVGGVLKCWGNGGRGRLGIGGTTNVNTPSVVDSGVSYKMVSAGKEHACAVTTGNVLKCWGSQSSGVLGDGVFGYTTYAGYPKVIDNGTAYESVVAGYYGSCGITSDKQLKCWGSYHVGNTTYRLAATPTEFFSIGDVVGIALHDATSCLLRSSGVVQCMGTNKNGELGLGYSNLAEDSKPIALGFSVKKYSLAADSSCLINSEDDLYCWGMNRYGNLGDGSKIDRSSPILIDAGTKYKEVSVGRYHTCGINLDGKLKCWGDNSAGAIGDGLSSTLRLRPAFVDVGYTYDHVSVGDAITCGGTSNGLTRCWGKNNNGQLGDGTKVNRNTPINVQYNQRLKSLAPTNATTCGLNETGDLICWGFESLLPQVLTGTQKYQEFFSTGNSSCGYTVSSTIECWGRNIFSNLGDGTTTDISVPTLTQPSSTYKLIAMGGYSTCGINPADELICWGNNTDSSLGVGTDYTIKVPARVDKDAYYKSVGRGFYHTCGITKTDEFICWGAMQSIPAGNGLASGIWIVSLP